MTTKERPILFSGAMVRALLAGTKTQTRRVVKPRMDRFTGCELAANELAGEVNAGDYTNSPYEPGDSLWVRETFFAFGRWETRFNAKKGRDEWHFVDLTLEMDRIYQYADPTPSNARHRSSVTPAWWKRPAIHMPRAASRITQEITGVRVEKLGDCSEANAAAEGVLPYAIYGGKVASWKANSETPAARETAVEAYRDLWDQINGAGAWDANPWVWVVEFRSAS